MTEEEGPLDETDGAPVGAQPREYWPTQKVFACLGTVTVVASAIPLAVLSWVPVAIPVVHGDEASEHLDWSTLFLPQNVVGSAIVLAFFSGVWIPFLMRSAHALKMVGSVLVFGWLCVGTFLASLTNRRLGHILSALVTWPEESLALGGPAFLFALAVAVPGIYIGIALENRTVLPWPASARHQSETPPGYADSAVGAPPSEP